MRSMAACLLIVTSFFPAANANTIDVNSKLDTVAVDGTCTLREAIIAANVNVASGLMTGECVNGSVAGVDTIAFAIPGPGPHTIFAETPLPDITSPVFVNGYSQPGSSQNTRSAVDEFDADIRIVLERSNPGSSGYAGIRFAGANAAGSRLSGLAIRNFESPTCCLDTGVYIADGAANVVLSGNVIHGNGARGVFVSNADNVRVGGAVSAGERNMIFDNLLGGVGADLSADDIEIVNNIFGAQVSGSQFVGAPDGASIAINGKSPFVFRNWIATNNGGALLLTQCGNGTVIANNTIGSAAASFGGVSIIALGGQVPEGCELFENEIFNQSHSGIDVVSPAAVGNQNSGHRFVRNIIVDNDGLGIDLSFLELVDGVTPNDAGDADVGPNGFQNFPLVGGLTVTADGLVVPYAIDGSEQVYDIEFSVSTECGASGHGPGGLMALEPFRYEGAAPMDTKTIPLLQLPSSGYVSATATGTLGTSEFSACVPYTSQFGVDVFANGFEG